MSQRTTCGTLSDVRQRGTLILGKVTFDSDLRFFDGHFPSEPVYPGAAQLQLVMEVLERSLGRPVRLTRIKRVKFSERIGAAHAGELRLEVDEERGRVRYDLTAGRVTYSSGLLWFEA